MPDYRIFPSFRPSCPKTRGSAMNIEYFAPLSRGFDLMKSALFRPFDIRTWFVVGFTAFLAEISGPGGSVPNFRQNYAGDDDIRRVLHFPDLLSEWMSDHPQLIVLIILGAAIALVIGVALLWVSARGRMMFLDNVVHGRAWVKAPWREFESLGNSLFFWLLGFGAICAVVFIPLIVYGFMTVREMYDAGEGFPDIALAIAAGVSVALFLGLVVLWVETLLSDFVVPIMYREKLKAMAAWRVFLPLLRAHPASFILYGLLKFFLLIVVGVAILLLGCATCCIGFILLLMPYIGSVVRLPVTYTFRSFSLYFLEQFGGQFAVFPAPAPAVDPDAPPSF
jgi:hypothetical protein